MAALFPNKILKVSFEFVLILWFYESLVYGSEKGDQRVSHEIASAKSQAILIYSLEIPDRARWGGLGGPPLQQLVAQPDQ